MIRYKRTISLSKVDNEFPTKARACPHTVQSVDLVGNGDRIIYQEWKGVLGILTNKVDD